MDKVMPAPVLVVGAGPVGLTAAANLARFGVPVRIIDSLAAPSQNSKALVIWRRSIHTLDPLIPCSHWLQGGRHLGGLDLADAGSVFASVDLHQPTAAPLQHMLPPGVMITQSQVESALTRLLEKKYGIPIERNTRLESFSMDAGSGLVRCMLSSTQTDSADQTAGCQELLASYLLGCDGSRSAVRKGLDVPFKGFSDPQNRFLMMDCTYEHVPGVDSHVVAHASEVLPQADRGLAMTTSVGLVLLIPLVDQPNAVRLVWNAGSQGPPKFTIQDFQSLLKQHTRLQIQLKDVLWQSEFSLNERQVDSYVHHGGRVLLAGDAAHVHSPAGGQGMNTGIQDAANLSWKVALAASEAVASPEQLLQTYHEERHPIGAAAVRFSGRLMRANAVRSPLLRFIRRVVLGLLLWLRPVQQSLEAAIAEDTVNYTTGSLARLGPGQDAPAAAPCSGTAFPDVSIRIDGEVCPATHLLRGGEDCFGHLVLLTTPVADSAAARHQIIGSSSTTAEADGDEGSAAAAADVSQWPTHWGGWHKLHLVSVLRQRSVDAGGDDAYAACGASTRAEDTWGLLSQAVRGADGVLVRPDGIIATAGGPQSICAWLEGHGF